MFETATIVAIVGTFFLAGTVKGVIGLGLPTVSLALLVVAIDLPSAMALLLVPSFVTNLWQGLAGGHLKATLLRISPFLAMATVTVWLGALALTRVDVALLSALLGALLVAYAAANLAGLRLAVPARHEAWIGPLAGAANGVLTGMTGSFVVPGVLFLQAIGLTREVLIQAMGLLFTASTVALALALGGNGLLTVELGTWSAAAVLPAILGMALGRRVRRGCRRSGSGASSSSPSCSLAATSSPAPSAARPRVQQASGPREARTQDRCQGDPARPSCGQIKPCRLASRLPSWRVPGGSRTSPSHALAG